MTHIYTRHFRALNIVTRIHAHNNAKYHLANNSGVIFYANNTALRYMKFLTPVSRDKLDSNFIHCLVIQMCELLSIILFIYNNGANFLEHETLIESGYV